MSNYQDLREEVEREVAEAIADGAEWVFVRFSLEQVKAFLDDYDAKCAELTRLQRLHEAAFVVSYGTGFGTPADEFDTNAAVARWKAGER